MKYAQTPPVRAGETATVVKIVAVRAEETAGSKSSYQQRFFKSPTQALRTTFTKTGAQTRGEQPEETPRLPVRLFLN